MAVPWAPLAAIPVRSLFEFYLATVLLVFMVYGLSRLRRDVASLQTQLLDMRQLAHQDILTRLPNRRALEAILAQAIALAERRTQGVAVILFDLDDFKRVNDEHGHDAGDRVLRDVATRGESVLRRPDTLGRWGGEEFLVIAPGIDLPGAMRVAERLRAALDSHPFGEVGTVTASFGVTTYHPGDTAETLLKRADDALYLAKQSGKDRVEALVRERVQHVVLPVLARPFPPLERDTDQLQRNTLTWLKDFEVAPAETLYRWVAAVQPGWLAGHMQRSNDATRLQIVSDWTFWMFLHDDHCDTSAAGRHPRYLIDLHQRLLGVLAGDAPQPQDGALATLLADLRDRLAVAAGEDAVLRFADATDRYFAATRWEAANRASGTTPDLETYERMRLLTSGLPVHTVLLETLDGVPVSDHPLAKALYAAADRAVCWANDIYSLNKEVQEEDVHNLVVALQASHHLGLDDALERAARMHDEQVARYQQLRASVDDAGRPGARGPGSDRAGAGGAHGRQRGLVRALQPLPGRRHRAGGAGDRGGSPGPAPEQRARGHCRDPPDPVRGPCREPRRRDPPPSTPARAARDPGHATRPEDQREGGAHGRPPRAPAGSGGAPDVAQAFATASP